jgi:SAM-dependent methyltransferase
MDVLRLPASNQRLRQEDNVLIASKDGSPVRIPVENGIPLFATEFIGEQGLIQQGHYDRISTAYVANLAELHTQEYSAYLDRALLDQIGNDGAHCTLEVCCGHGEAAKVLAMHSARLIGQDASSAMLQTARQTYKGENYAFIQADATSVPISTASVDMVIMLGGIHHSLIEVRFLKRSFVC